jgi:hypothetical protein
MRRIFIFTIIYHLIPVQHSILHKLCIKRALRGSMLSVYLKPIHMLILSLESLPLRLSFVIDISLSACHLLLKYLSVNLSLTVSFQSTCPIDLSIVYRNKYVKLGPIQEVTLQFISVKLNYPKIVKPSFHLNVYNGDLLFRIFNAYVYRVFQKAKAKKKSKSHKTKSHKSAKLQEKQRRTFNSLGRKMDIYIL